METTKCIADVKWNKKHIPGFLDDWSERYFMKAQNLFAKLFNILIGRWNKNFNALYGDVDCSEEPMYSTYNKFIGRDINETIMPFINRKFLLMRFHAGSECELVGHIKFIPGSRISFDIVDLNPLEEP